MRVVGQRDVECALLEAVDAVLDVPGVRVDGAAVTIFARWWERKLEGWKRE